MSAEVAELPDALERARETVERAMKDDPYLATAAALGAGFLLGGGLTRSMMALLLGAGSRFVAAWLGEQILEASAPDERES